MMTTTFKFDKKTIDQTAEKLYRDGLLLVSDRKGYCVITGEFFPSGTRVYKLSPGSKFAGIETNVKKVAEANRELAKIKKNAFTVPLDERFLDYEEEKESVNEYKGDSLTSILEPLPQQTSLNVSNDQVVAELQGIKQQLSGLGDLFRNLVDLTRGLIKKEVSAPLIAVPSLEVAEEHLDRITSYKVLKNKETPKCPTKQEIKRGKKLSSKLINTLTPLERAIITVLESSPVLEGSPTGVLGRIRSRFPHMPNLPKNARELSKDINKLNLNRLGIKIVAKHYDKSTAGRYLRLELVK